MSVSTNNNNNNNNSESNYISDIISFIREKSSETYKIISNIYLSFISNDVNIRDPNSIVDWLSLGIKYCDLGGEEIYYMFVGGIIFIVLSHLISFIFNDIIFKYFISFKLCNNMYS